MFRFPYVLGPCQKIRLSSVHVFTFPKLVTQIKITRREFKRNTFFCAFYAPDLCHWVKKPWRSRFAICLLMGLNGRSHNSRERRKADKLPFTKKKKTLKRAVTFQSLNRYRWGFFLFTEKKRKIFQDRRIQRKSWFNENFRSERVGFIR